MQTVSSCAVSFFVALSLSGCGTLNLGHEKPLTPAEKMMWSTYAVATARGVGTCLLINRKDPGSDRIIPVLVTATHVLSVAPHGPYYLAMRIADAEGNPDIAVLEIMPEQTGRTAYTANPHGDIAALELRMPAEMADTIGLPSFIDEEKISSPDVKMHPGEMVALLGFPSVLPATEGGFPILRTGAIASYAPGNLGRGDRYLINTMVYPGDSGGPVFTLDRGRRSPVLVGLVTEHIGRNVSTVPLTVAINARAIRETLQLLPHGNIRAEEIPVLGTSSGSRASTVASTVKGPAHIFIRILRPGQIPAYQLSLAPLKRPRR